MKVLTVLKYLINFIFYAFLISAIVMMAMPFMDHSYTNFGRSFVFGVYIVFPLIHLSIIFMILYYLRKFVHNSDRGTPFDEPTRNYLKMSGVFCLISGLLRIPELTGILTFYSVTGEYNPSLIANGFLDFGSFFYIIIIGLFFIYLSKVLESSDAMRQENNLTI